MISSLELVLTLDDADELAAQRAQAAQILQVSPERITEIRVRRRSLDARRAPIRLRLLCDVWTDESAPPETLPQIEYSILPNSARQNLANEHETFVNKNAKVGESETSNGEKTQLENATFADGNAEISRAKNENSATENNAETRDDDLANAKNGDAKNSNATKFDANFADEKSANAKNSHEIAARANTQNANVETPDFIEKEFADAEIANSQIEYSNGGENGAQSEIRALKTVIIVGCGPAGMFAALELLQRGIKPILLERGKDVQARRRDLAKINREGVVDSDSNYCFGEGGAGTYSDGKLYTRVKDKNAIRRVLETLVSHGAPHEILIEAHPHIGSNKLPKVVAAMRETILRAGGEIRFGTRVVDFVIENNRARGVITANGDEIVGDSVILASGHSGREIFEILARNRVLVQPKAFAMGVRIEHPQPLIDEIQYRHARFEKRENGEWRHPKLPAASYRLAQEVDGRGVFSFCMCPGGWIVPSATRSDEIVVNGMSLSRRDSPFANSGMVVSVDTDDLAAFSAHGDLAGMAFQRDLETRARTFAGNAGEFGQKAPAQRVTDFLANRVSASLPACSYQPGIVAASMHEVLPASIAKRLQVGLQSFGRSMRGYVTENAVLIGVETRTSSPVRVPREENRQHPQIAGLFPCGEGAGYAGGIVSAAIDGANCAAACAASIEYSKL